MLQKCILIAILISASLYAGGISSHVRPDSKNQLLKGSKAQNIPYGYFIPNFSKTSMKIIDGMDFSTYSNKKVLVGYGVFDVKQDNCRYLDADQTNFRAVFKNIAVVNKKTFAISRDPMSYNACMSLASQYHGVVFTPSGSSNEATVMRRLFKDVSQNESWIGYSRLSCSDNYLNAYGLRQTFEHFQRGNEGCVDGYFNVKYNKNTKRWKKTLSSESLLCPIEIDSPDYERPTKVCLPWWRVERVWRNDVNSTGVVYNGREYDFTYMKYTIDYPKEETICLKTKQSGSISGVSFPSQIGSTKLKCVTSENVFEKEYDKEFQANCNVASKNETYGFAMAYFKCTQNGSSGNSYTCKQKPKRYERTCLSYNSIKASKVCLDDINLDVCKVDECAGYIRDTCQKINSYVPFKNYDYGYIVEDGSEKRVMTRANKQISVYSCPEPPTSVSNCEEAEVVDVFPAHCPGSKCKELSQCLRAGIKSKNECYSTYKCEKIYGSVDAVVRDSNGEAIGLEGVCSDGTIVQSTINTKSKSTKKCVKYKVDTTTISEDVRCVSEATSSEHNISTAITTDDIYATDEKCVRTNNLEEARPSVSTVLDYETKGYFKTIIKKASVDENVTSQAPVSSTSIYQQVIATQKLKEFDSSSPKTQAEFPSVLNFAASGKIDTTEHDRVSAYCSAKIPESSISQRVHVLANGSPSYVAGLKGIVQAKPGSVLNTDKCDNGFTLTSGKCVSNTSACGSDTFDKIYNKCVRPDNTKYTPTCPSGLALLKDDVCGKDPYYSYAVIGVKSGISCSNAASKTGLSVATKKVLPSDYDLSSIGVSASDIENGNYCVIGGNLITGDIFSYVKGNGSKDVYMETKDPIPSSECSDLAKCVSGDVISSGSTCEIKAYDKPYSEPPSTVKAETPIKDLVLPTKTDSYTMSFNGYSDVFFIADYVDGDFGYYSNYLSKLPKNNVVKIKNKEAFPIVGIEPIDHAVKYQFNNKWWTETTKNKKPTQEPGHSKGFQTYIPELSKFDDGIDGFDDVLLFVDGVEEKLGSFAFGTAIVLDIMMLFGTEHKFGIYYSNYSIYEPIPKTYVENVYGYDQRMLVSNEGRIYYGKMDVSTGTMQSGDFETTRRNMISEKTDILKSQGFSTAAVTVMTNSSPETTPPDYKRFEWYEFKGRRHDDKSQSGQKDVNKQLSTVYLGATNYLSIIVPYKGEYELKAYNASGDLLGSVTVNKFIRNSTSSIRNNAMAYAKVNFALSEDFNIAPNQNREMTSGSCLASSEVEWGGGVSGIFVEDRPPDVSGPCKKSTDFYVKANSATKITVRALNSNKPVAIELPKPMPYANKTVLVTSDFLETRKYRCYSEINPCTIDQNASDLNITIPGAP